MKKTICLFTALIMMFSSSSSALFTSAVPSEEYPIYVSVNGDDSADGSKEHPLATLKGAKERAKTVSKLTTVYFSAGTYRFDGEVIFGDGDREDITYKAMPGEEVIFTSGKEYSGFTPCTVNGVNALCKEVESDDFNVLFSEKELLKRTRYPESGYLAVADVSDGYCVNSELEIDREFHLGYSAFFADKKDISEFKNITDAVVRVLHFWKDEMLPVESYDASTGLLKFGKPTSMTVNEGDRYFFENVIEALDSPGEWYLDKAEGKLYYIPYEGETAENLTLWGSDTQTLISVDGVDGISFEGIIFRGNGFEISPERDFSQAAYDAPSCITYNNAKGFRIKNCEFRDIAACAVFFGKAVRKAGVYSCVFEDIGAQAVYIRGENVPAESENVTKDITVSNCIISGYGKQYYNAVGLLVIHACSVMLSNNEIHDGYYTAISVGWVWGYDYNVTYANTISNNLIYDIGQGWLSDMGGIYTLGNQSGTVISGNVIHNVAADPGEGGYGGWGIYLDEGSSYIKVEKNLVYSCGNDGYHLHYGSYNRVRNNIFALNGDSQMRIVTNTKRVTPAVGGTLTAEISHNIILTKDKTRAYSFMTGTEFFTDESNIFYDLTEGADVYFDKGDNAKNAMCLERAEAKGYLNNPYALDPMFKDAENFDFELAENSPVFDTGFEKTDYSKAGTVPGTTVGVSTEGGQTPYNKDSSAVEMTAAKEPFHLIIKWFYKLIAFIKNLFN